jgi:lipoate-protein ligase A
VPSKSLQLITLQDTPILEQLQIEEALLRIDAKNYCIINHGSSSAIVMGISGKVEELIDEKVYQKRSIPIIRRFSGGGTVLIEQDVLFLTFIFNRHDEDVGSCPQRLMHWTRDVLAPVFAHTDFQVRENDYVIGEKKFGGNAQYFTKDRWLHHTSLLWDFCPEAMKILKMPPKVPEYRQNRAHGDFLTKLKEHFESKEAFLTKVREALSQRFLVREVAKDALLPILQKPHRKATEVVLCKNG